MILADHILADCTTMPAYVARMKARGIDALMVSDWSGNPSPTGIKACRDHGVRLIWMMRQAQEDAPDLNGSVSPPAWAAGALRQLIEAGARPEEIAGVAMKDEPVLYTPNDTIQKSIDYGHWLRECAVSLAAQWNLRPDCLIWWNCNTPSGRRIDHAGRAAVSILDYADTGQMHKAYSLETWMGDDGGRMQIAGFSSVHKMLALPLVVYAIGQTAGPQFDKILAEAKISGAQLTVLYHQAMTAQDSYWDNRRAVLDGLSRFTASAPQPAATQTSVTLEWPYLGEVQEKEAPGINVVRNHPAENDYAHVIEQWCRLLAHLFWQPRLNVGWAMDAGRATYKMPAPNYYPIGQYVGPNGLKQSHFDTVIKGCDAIYWMWLLSQSGLSIDRAWSSPQVKAAQQKVVQPTLDLLAGKKTLPPLPPPTPAPPPKLPPRVNPMPQIRRNPRRTR
jgi:hypothetical protein